MKKIVTILMLIVALAAGTPIVMDAKKPNKKPRTSKTTKQPVATNEVTYYITNGNMRIENHYARRVSVNFWVYGHINGSATNKNEVRGGNVILEPFGSTNIPFNLNSRYSNYSGKITVQLL